MSVYKQRVTMTQVNNTLENKIINFEGCGQLSNPLNATNIMVRRFSVPNAAIEIMKFPANTYQLTLAYGAYSVSQYVVLSDWGQGNYLYTINQLVSMINDAFDDAITALKVLDNTLPTTTPPYLSYDNTNSVFSLISLTAFYATTVTKPIYVYFNPALATMLNSLPMKVFPSNPTATRNQMVIVATVENIYQTSYTKLTQEQVSTALFATPRLILISTNMPVQTEVFSVSGASAPSNINVLQSYVLAYENGIKDLSTNNDFNIQSEPLRVSRINAVNLRDISCALYVQDVLGTVSPIYLPPGQSATISFEFW